MTAVIAHLRKCGIFLSIHCATRLVDIHQLTLSGTVSTIAIWGHSMGAATALMFSHTDPSIAALVLDCGFAGLFTTEGIV